MILESVIAGISVFGVIVTVLFNATELFLEHRKNKNSQEHQTQLVEIKNYIKESSSSSSPSE